MTANKPAPKPIDLSKFFEAKQLEALGLDRLKVCFNQCENRPPDCSVHTSSLVQSLTRQLLGCGRILWWLIRRA